MPTVRFGQRRVLITTVVVLLLAVLVAATLFIANSLRHEAPGSPAPEKSVAVLPLVNESGDPDQDYFADGLSEELIATLAQIPDLKVISRHSAFQFRGRQDNYTDIAARLGVATLLEGTVRQHDGEVRVTTNLIDADANRVLWSHSYVRAIGDIFAVQSDIARAVATALESRFERPLKPHDDRPPGGNVEAWNALLEGRYHFYTVNGSAADARRAIAEFTRATTLDPDYAVAHAMLSSAWTNLAGTYLSGAEAERAYALAHSAVVTALAQAPDLALAHIANGYLLSSAGFDWRGAEAAFRRALQLAPADGAAKVGLANQLASLGQLKEAVSLTRSALQTDPLHVNWYANLGGFLSALGQLDEAERAMRKALELQPGGVDYYATLTMIDIQRHDYAAALADAKHEPSAVWRRYALALAYAVQPGQHEQANHALDEMIRLDSDGMAYQIAEVHALRGHADQAFAWLQRAQDNRDAGLAYLLQDPALLRYRDDPRFQALCKELNLPGTSEAKALVLSLPRSPH